MVHYSIHVRFFFANSLFNSLQVASSSRFDERDSYYYSIYNIFKNQNSITYSNMTILIM